MNFTFPPDQTIGAEAFMDYIIDSVGTFVSEKLEVSAKSQVLGKKTFTYLMKILSAIMDEDRFKLLELFSQMFSDKDAKSINSYDVKFYKNL
jgi:hypothetical protein